MKQNNIKDILKKNPLIPVATIKDISQIEEYYLKLKAQDIFCIEITLRTDFSWKAIELFKANYGQEFKIGVGTVTSKEDVLKCKSMGVDFMVSPGTSINLIEEFNKSEIPYISGVSTPSEIIQFMELGCNCFKFFPANIFGGLEALKNFSNLFSEIQFCPTGGINASNFKDYLALPNVISVGGSWLLK